jgi:hypothetical protein
VDSNDEPPQSINSETELTTEEYDRIAASDNQRYTSPDPGDYDEASIKYDFVLDETIGEGTIDEIRIIWEGYPGGSYSSSDVTLWVWNFNGGSWNNAATVSCPGGQDTTITAIIEADFTNYIYEDENTGDLHILVCAQNRRDSQTIITNYVEVRFTYEPSEKLYLDPGLIFEMNRDGGVPNDGGTRNASYIFILNPAPNWIEINWVLIPDSVAQDCDWKISLEGVTSDTGVPIPIPTPEISGSGQPERYVRDGLPAGNYTANFWVQNNHISRPVFAMPFSSSRAGNPDYTWLMIGSSYQAFIITSTAREIDIDGNGNRVIVKDGNTATITAYAYRSPGPVGWWKQQNIDISSWIIDY